MVAASQRLPSHAMRLGLVYLPERACAARWEALARALVVGRTPRIVLGPGRMAHVTLLHVETDLDPATIWDEALSVLPARMPLPVQALGLLPYDVPYHAPPAPPATMAWLMIPCSSALRDAERRACALASVRRSVVTTGNGDAFQPHATIAIWDGPAAPSLPDDRLPRDVLGAPACDGRLALGPIAANGVFTEVLFSV